METPRGTQSSPTEAPSLSVAAKVSVALMGLVTLGLLVLAWPRNVGWGCGLNDSGSCRLGLVVPGVFVVALATVLLCTAVIMWFRKAPYLALVLLALSIIGALWGVAMQPADPLT